LYGCRHFPGENEDRLTAQQEPSGPLAAFDPTQSLISQRVVVCQTHGHREARSHDSYHLLTDCEKEVLYPHLLAEGRSNKEVATLLDLGCPCLRFIETISCRNSIRTTRRKYFSTQFATKSSCRVGFRPLSRWCTRHASAGWWERRLLRGLSLRWVLRRRVRVPRLDRQCPGNQSDNGRLWRRSHNQSRTMFLSLPSG
jgi:hypothetical protein